MEKFLRMTEATQSSREGGVGCLWLVGGDGRIKMGAKKDLDLARGGLGVSPPSGTEKRVGKNWSN